jgi:hypothetical protein
MRKNIVTVAVFLLATGFTAGAHATLNGFLRDLNVQASTNLHDFSVRVAAQFNIPGAQVEAVIQKVDSPADAFMIFQLGKMANRPPEEVMETYRTGKGRGWGVIAKQLGIRPGSPEFHALQRGDFALTGGPGERPDAAAAKGRGRGRGRGKADD